MRKFIEEQPVCIAAGLRAGHDNRGQLPLGPESSSLFIGSGTSRHALMAVRPMFVGRTDVIGPVTYLAGGHSADHVLVLSQIGTSATTLEAAQAAQASGAKLLVLTAEPESPIARLGAPTLHVPASGETIGPKTKGYTGSLATLIGLAGQFAAPEAAFDELSFSNFVGKAEGLAMTLAQTLDGADFVLFAGDAEHHATGLEASLKVAEVAGLPTAAFEIEETLHGRMHGLSTRSLALFLVATAARRDSVVNAARVMEERGVRVLLVNMTAEATPYDWVHLPGIDPPLATIYAVIPMQWLAMQLALRRGMSPDRMRFPGLSKALSIKVV